MRMIYFVGEGISSPVLDSQVIVPLQILGRHAPEVERALLVLTSIRYCCDAKTHKRARVIRDSLPDIKVLLKYRTLLYVPFDYRLWVGQLRRALQACGYLGNAPIVVHCRGQKAAAAAAQLKRRDPRIRILFDLRGAETDEIAGSGLLARYLRARSDRTLAAALAGADGLNTVTQRLADYLRESGFLRRELPSAVVGCCVDTERFHFDPAVRAARRKELGLEGKFVVCYCGAMSHWQRPDALAEVFAAIRGDMPDAHFLILSREPGPLRAELERVGVPEAEVTIRSAPHTGVASLMMAADVGLLLRENSLTNQVASPVKFAEYLRCGLPVILTPYIGDFGTFVTQHGVGATLSFPIQSAEAVAAARIVRTRLEAEGDAFRRRCSEAAANHLSWEKQIDNLIGLYRTL